MPGFAEASQLPDGRTLRTQVFSWDERICKAVEFPHRRHNGSPIETPATATEVASPKRLACRFPAPEDRIGDRPQRAEADDNRAQEHQ